MGTFIAIVLMGVFVIVIETGYLARTISKIFKIKEMEESENNEKH